MSWLPFVCLLVGMGVLAVLYSRTVGHVHRMVHLLDDALGVHEKRLDTSDQHILEIAGIVERLARLEKERVEEELSKLEP